MSAPLRAAALAALLFGCASHPEVDYGEPRAASEAFVGDPIIEARRELVEAARAREQSEVLIDEFELRLGDEFRTENSQTHDNRLRMTTRIPIPLPGDLRARRELRRAETEAALSRLDEAVLERSAEDCLRNSEAGEHRAHSEIYDAYASTYDRLIALNEESRAAGRINERVATRFAIESRIRLATRMPGPAPLEPPLSAPLPAIGRPDRRLQASADLVRQTVRERHPGVSRHRANAMRFQALGQSAQNQSRPWPRFVDLTYEANANSDRREAGGQIAFRVPLGDGPVKNAERFGALSRSERRLSEGEVEERVRFGLMALREIDSFEQNTTRWQELLTLASEAETVAERWWQERLATASQVGALLDHAHAARTAVAEARAGAATARCTLLASTGLAVEEWPRD